MITLKQYKRISDKYGDIASWAVWKKAGQTPKSNISNMDVFDLRKNRDLLSTLKTNVVMVGLNRSRTVGIDKPFKNFHSEKPYANDFKIRYAFEDTPYYGAYMTDIIKNVSMKSSKNLFAHLNRHPDRLKEHINAFREEMLFIGANRPIILAFGKDAYNILYISLKSDEYSDLVRLTHYSHRISKENYKKDTHEKLYEQLKYSSSKLQFFIDTEEELKRYVSIIDTMQDLTESERAAAVQMSPTIKTLLGKIIEIKDV